MPDPGSRTGVPPARPGPYAELGVRTVINAHTTLTRLGGSLMPEPVVAAMADAAGRFVDMFELQAAVGRDLAARIGVPAAYVTSGAAAGLHLAVLACMTGADRVDIAAFADDPTAWPRRRIVIHAAQRNPYDRVLRLASAVPTTVGDTWQTFPWELEAAVRRPDVAAVLWFAGEHLAKGALPLRDVVDIAHRGRVPVIVDAAAQAVPPANLRAFVDSGADLVAFSGGKALRGPQASGLLVGRADLITAVTEHGPPHQRLGRAMKLGKEELLGLRAAVLWFLARDHDADVARQEAVVAGWIDALGGLPGVRAAREFPGEAGMPMPRCRIDVAPGVAASVASELWELDPRVAVGVSDDGTSLLLSPDCLGDGEAEVVERAVAQALHTRTERSVSHA